MAPLLLLAALFGLVVGFVMGWIGGRLQGIQEGYWRARHSHCYAPAEDAPTASAPVAQVVVLVQSQGPPPQPLAAPTVIYPRGVAELGGADGWRSGS